jgi:hypothetical protein
MPMAGSSRFSTGENNVHDVAAALAADAARLASRFDGREDVAAAIVRDLHKLGFELQGHDTDAATRTIALIDRAVRQIQATVLEHRRSPEGVALARIEGSG